jgi:hypothetical protein
MTLRIRPSNLLLPFLFISILTLGRAGFSATGESADIFALAMTFAAITVCVYGSGSEAFWNDSESSFPYDFRRFQFGLQTAGRFDSMLT